MGIELKEVSIRYGRNTIIDSISIKVEQGEIFTILGKSGVGKSSILRAVAGLVTPNKGQVLLDGMDLSDLPADKRNIAMVFQKPLLFPHLDVRENIAFGLKMHDWTKTHVEDRVMELLELLKIGDLEARMPSEISGGQQQRVAIARALALKNRILLMDEPFSSLDPYLKEEMYDMLDDIRKKLELAVIFVTHDVSEALAVSDRVGYVAEGVMVQDGSPNELYNYPVSRDLAEFLGPANWVDGEVRNNRFLSPYCDVELPEESKAGEGKAQMLIRPHDLKLLKEPQSIDKNLCNFKGSCQVVSSERKGSETTTIVSLGKRELKVIQADDLDFVKGEPVIMQLLNPYRHVIRMD